MQVMSYDNAGNAIVGGIKTADIPTAVRLPWNSTTPIKIPMGTQNVIIETPDHRSVLIGQITEPVGGDAGTALSRELVLANGTSAQFFAGKVYTQESCNATALSPIVYEHTLHRMRSDFIVLTQNGANLPIALNPRDLGTIRTISSPIPCNR